MALQKQVAPLSLAMDSDSGDKYINTSGGVVRERINMRINELNGESLFNKKLKGNTLVDITMPAGTNKCIGWCADHKTESLLWFVYNSIEGMSIDDTVAYVRAALLGYVGTLNQYKNDLSEFDGTTGENPYSDYLFQISETNYAGTYNEWLSGIAGHSILRYLVNSDTVQRVWYAQPGLEFQDTFLSASVADGRVSWVNGTEQPKSFNIEKAVNYTNSLAGDAYLSTDDIETEILPLIKRPPQFAPEVSYTSVVEEAGLVVNFNNLRGKLFQFKYNFVYEDDQESAYSKISKVPLPEGDLTLFGEWIDNFSKNNAIDVNINTGDHLVKKINIAARIASNLNVGEFNVFKIIDKFNDAGEILVGDNSPYIARFLNNGNIRNINTDINNRYCDDVPLSASGIALLAGKYQAMAMPVKGYENVTAGLELIHIFEDFDFSAANEKMPMEILYGYSNNFNWYSIKIESHINCIYRLNVTTGSGDIVPAEYTVEGINPGVELIRDFLYDRLNADPRAHDSWGIAKGGADSIAISIRFVGTVTADESTNFTGYIFSGTISSVPSFKRGQYHKIGIVYNDKFGRYNIVNNDSTIFVPHAYPLGSTYDRISKIYFNITHRPPVQAETYSFVYAKNSSYTYFLDAIDVECILSGTDNIQQGHTFLRINQAIESYRDVNTDVTIPDYVWVKGDKCRSYLIDGFISLVSDDNLVYDISKPFTRVHHKIYDNEPLEDFEEDGFLINTEIETILRDGKRYAHLEIFRPNYEFTGNLFYETGDSYPILDAGTESRSHAANIHNQHADLSASAYGYLTFGDVYMRQRISADNVLVVEDSSYSDFYVSNCMDKGREVIKLTTNFKQKELYRVVRSENFIEGSEYNLLNVFLPQTDFFTVSQSYGPITGIIEVGDVLKIIQEHKETSVYIGKASLKQADGTSITVISDRVFNEGNKYDSLHGTKYPRSISGNERNLYYLDDTTGDLIRSAPNGQESISAHYNMKSYFKAKVAELRASLNYTDVIISIDSLYDEVLITFINGSSSETIAFYEKEGQKGFTYKAHIKPVSGVPDNFAWYGDKLLSFLSGKLYKHNTGEESTFYGDRKPCSISFIVNAGAGDANKFSDIEMSSPDNVWDVQFDIEAGSNYPVQKSILKPGIIREKENRLYSGILRNILGRNNTEDISKLRNGSQMTGETMLVTISNDTAGDYLLKEVEVKFLTSK